MKRFTLVLSVLFVLFALPALATETDGSPLAAALAGVLEGVVFPVVTFFLLGLLGILLQRLSAKYKLEVLAKNQDAIERAAYNAIAWVEEVAAAKLKQQEIKIGSSAKMTMAVTKILEAVPKLTQEQARAAAESMLAKVKGAGATGETALQ